MVESFDGDIEIVVQKPKVKRKSKRTKPANKRGTAAPAPTIKNPQPDINSDWFSFLLFAAIYCLICLILFCGYGIPMFMLERLSSGDTQKVIVTPFSDYSSEYHVAHPCIYPPFFEPLEGSFPCDNTDMHWLSNNSTAYCPHTYGCLPLMEYPYLTCASLDQACSGLDLSPDGVCMKVPQMQQNDDRSKMILFDTVTQLCVLQFFAAFVLLLTLIGLVALVVMHYNTKQVTKNSVLAAGCLILIMIITTLMLLVFGIVYLCTVEEIDSVGNYRGSVCFDKATKDLFSRVDSSYIGVLVVFSLAAIAWAVSDLFVGVMFFISYQKLSKSQYELDLPFAQSQP